jgi:hypothetical protein
MRRIKPPMQIPADFNQPINKPVEEVIAKHEKSDLSNPKFQNFEGNPPPLWDANF